MCLYTRAVNILYKCVINLSDICFLCTKWNVVVFVFFNFFCSLGALKLSCWNLVRYICWCCFQGCSNTLLYESQLSTVFFFWLKLLCSLPLLSVPDHTECYESSETTTEDADLWSREMKADETLKISHQTIASLLLGVGSQLENEDYLTGISCRLQTALEKMLMVITDTTNQVLSHTNHIYCVLNFCFHTPNK